MKFAIFAALIAITLPAPAFAADWVLTSENVSGTKFYIDRQSIRTMPNGYKRAWVRSNHKIADKSERKSSMSYWEFDCIERRDRVLSLILYSGDQAKNSNEVKDWDYVTPDTARDKLFKFLCQK